MPSAVSSRPQPASGGTTAEDVSGCSEAGRAVPLGDSGFTRQLCVLFPLLLGNGQTALAAGEGAVRSDERPSSWDLCGFVPALPSTPAPLCLGAFDFLSRMVPTPGEGPAQVLLDYWEACTALPLLVGRGNLISAGTGACASQVEKQGRRSC